MGPSTAPDEPPAASATADRPTPHAGIGDAPSGAWTALPHGNRKRLSVLILGALGIVFGDIGTSPLYTLRECLRHAAPQGEAALRADVMHLLSLIFWSMTVVVTLKYLVFIMKADNRGEGGIMALLALVPERHRSGPLDTLSIVTVLVVIGASFLYGDGAITPAISVLSAVEGIAVAQPGLQGAVVPVTIAILICLFAIQSRGTHLIGVLFGPVMVVYFAVIGGLGAWHIAQAPEVLVALSPHHAVLYFVEHGPRGILVLGAVVLCVTGGEALYADMGHFSLKSIRRAWMFFVMPALVLSYFGQGALVLRDPKAIENPFFLMVPPGGATYALVVLSSLAAVIASQALISGSFSLTRQAMQMGFFPRVTIKHTAEEAEGQIYIPEINTFLAVVCIILVLWGQSSERLAAAYGLAVTATMTITTIVFYLVLRTHMCWKRSRALMLCSLFLAFDIPFLIGNMFKIPAGGYVPLLLGGVFVTVMLVWHEGRRLVGGIYSTRFPSFDDAWPTISQTVAQRVGGVGVFLASTDHGVPPILVHLVERTRSLHKTIILLTVVTKQTPTVEPRDRLNVEEIGHGFWRVHVNYGFKQQPDVPQALGFAVKRRWLDFDMNEVTYYLARERILAGPGGDMSVLFESLFGFMMRNAVNADRYFRIPPSKVIEVGAQIDL